MRRPNLKPLKAWRLGRYDIPENSNIYGFSEMDVQLGTARVSGLKHTSERCGHRPSSDSKRHSNWLLVLGTRVGMPSDSAIQSYLALCGQLGLSKPLLVDLQGFDLGIECRLRNSELCRRSARTRYSAVAVGKGRLDHMSLLDGQFLSER